MTDQTESTETETRADLAGQNERLVSWPPAKLNKDDFVFVFRHKEKGVLVYGRGDTENNLDSLKENGYEHTATLSAAIVLENAIAMSNIHDVWEAIHYIDN